MRMCLSESNRGRRRKHSWVPDLRALPSAATRATTSPRKTAVEAWQCCYHRRVLRLTTLQDGPINSDGFYAVVAWEVWVISLFLITSITRFLQLHEAKSTPWPLRAAVATVPSTTLPNKASPQSQWNSQMKAPQITSIWRETICLFGCADEGCSFFPVHLTGCCNNDHVFTYGMEKLGTISSSSTHRSNIKRDINRKIKHYQAMSGSKQYLLDIFWHFTESVRLLWVTN